METQPSSTSTFVETKPLVLFINHFNKTVALMHHFFTLKKSRAEKNVPSCFLLTRKETAATLVAQNSRKRQKKQALKGNIFVSRCHVSSAFISVLRHHWWSHQRRKLFTVHVADSIKWTTLCALRHARTQSATVHPHLAKHFWCFAAKQSCSAPAP